MQLQRLQQSPFLQPQITQTFNPFCSKPILKTLRLQLPKYTKPVVQTRICIPHSYNLQAYNYVSIQPTNSLGA